MSIHFVLFSIDLFKKKHRVLFEDDDLEYNGVPYIVLSQKMYDCHHGKDRNIIKKEKYREKKNALAIS